MTVSHLGVCAPHASVARAATRVGVDCINTSTRRFETKARPRFFASLFCRRRNSRIFFCPSLRRSFNLASAPPWHGVLRDTVMCGGHSSKTMNHESRRDTSWGSRYVGGQRPSTALSLSHPVDISTLRCCGLWVPLARPRRGAQNPLDPVRAAESHSNLRSVGYCYSSLPKRADLLKRRPEIEQGTRAEDRLSADRAADDRPRARSTLSRSSAVVPWLL